MNLKSLLLSSDEKTVRILRRVLSDLDIGIELCDAPDDGIRRITRRRFEAIIVDCADSETASTLLRAAKVSPVNKRALSIALVESPVGLRGGFDMGAHFVLHKPLAVERAKASFRAVRAMMKRERRLQLRVPVQVPVECVGAGRYQGKTLDICEGGMAVKFTGRIAKESCLRFALELPGLDQKLEFSGEMAWENNGNQAGVRFTNVTEEQRNALRLWLSKQLPEPEPDDPPVTCRLTDLSPGACYLTTTAPFPKSTRVILAMRTADLEVRAAGVVRITHAEFGMGVEFVQATAEQQNQVRRVIETLRASGEAPELQVEPDGMEPTVHERPAAPPHTDDALVDLFRHQSALPVDAFLEQMQQQRHVQESR
jgi:PilZ domain